MAVNPFSPLVAGLQQSVLTRAPSAGARRRPKGAKCNLESHLLLTSDGCRGQNKRQVTLWCDRMEQIVPAELSEDLCSAKLQNRDTIQLLSTANTNKAGE